MRFCQTYTFFPCWTYAVPSHTFFQYKEAMYIYIMYIYHGPLIPIKITVQFFECKIPERVLLNGAISICRRFSKVSHWFEAKMCGLSLLAIFTFWVFTLWHITLVLYSKRKSSITAPAPLTTKLISKQARLNATKSVLVCIKFNPRKICQHCEDFTKFDV